MITPQFVDPDVSRAKFDREIDEFRALEGSYRQRGWFLVRAEFPHALVLLAAPQLSPPAIVTGVSFDYTNYDAQPPSVRLVNPFTSVPYRKEELPTQLNRSALESLESLGIGMPVLPPGAQFKVNAIQPLVQVHSSTEDMPFLCLAGVREYHDHPGHSGDAWELHRSAGAGRLVRLLEIICKYGVQPINGYGVQLVPHVKFQYGPVPE